MLVRSNRRAQDVIAALTERGIPASGEGRPILATREGRLVRAALAVTLDLSEEAPEAAETAEAAETDAEPSA